MKCCSFAPIINVSNMRQLTQITLLLIYILSSCTQEKKYPYKTSDFRPELEKHLNKIVAIGKLSNTPDTLTRNFLRDSCTKKEILHLLSCESPLIRITAYRAIVNRNELDYFSILKNHLDDTTKVEWWYYDDAAGDFMVSDLMIRKAIENRRILSQAQKDTLVGLVLLKHPYLEISNWMIQEIKPNEKYYSLIRKRATTVTERCGEQMGASYALAKFKKANDIPLLKANFMNSEAVCSDWAFQSIENFPDTAFYPVLIKYFNQQIKKKQQSSYEGLKYYCRAVAIYKNKKSLEILTSLTDRKTYLDSWYLSDNKENIFLAIHKYKHPLYNDLYNKLEPQMSEYALSRINEPGRLDPFDRKMW